MKIGIFAGGFKPFHTGHFGKVALALEENDEVYLFYGVQSEKAKNPTRRRIGSREFTPKMSKRIFEIIKPALEREYGDRIRVFDVHRPVGAVVDKIRQLKDDPLEKLKVYGRIEDLRRYYINNRHLMRDVQDLYDSGVLEFGTISPNESEGLSAEELSDLEVDRISKALSGTYPEASDEELRDYSGVSATAVRNMIDTKDVDALKRYLPNFLTSDEEDQIIDVLLERDVQAEAYLRYLIRGIIKG